MKLLSNLDRMQSAYIREKIELFSDKGFMQTVVAKITSGKRRGELVFPNEVQVIRDDDEISLVTKDDGSEAVWIYAFIDLFTGEIVRVVKDKVTPCKWQIGDVLYESGWEGFKKKGTVTSFSESVSFEREYDDKENCYTGVLIRETIQRPVDENGKLIYGSYLFSEKEFENFKKNTTCK